MTANYGKHERTVSTVQMVCEQYANGYHLTDNDIKGLIEAIYDLSKLLSDVTERGIK